MAKRRRNQLQRRTGGHITEDGGFRKGIEAMEREGLETMDWPEGHDCKEGRLEKSKPEAERSRGLEEKTGKAEDETGAGLEGQDRASVTTFLEPGIWTMLLVNSDI